MKTYFMAWESDYKRGHTIMEFDVSADGEDITPRQALSAMIDLVFSENEESEVPLLGVVSALQFNRVD